jgi:hypothetical protein
VLWIMKWVKLPTVISSERIYFKTRLWGCVYVNQVNLYYETLSYVVGVGYVMNLAIKDYQMLVVVLLRSLSTLLSPLLAMITRSVSFQVVRLR